MNIVSCTKGHYFDLDSYQTCPHCGSSIAAATPTQQEDKQQKKGVLNKVFGKKHADKQKQDKVEQTQSFPQPQVQTYTQQSAMQYSQPQAQAYMPMPSQVPAPQPQYQMPQQVAPVQQVNPVSPSQYQNAAQSATAYDTRDANGSNTTSSGKVRNMFGNTMAFWDVEDYEDIAKGKSSKSAASKENKPDAQIAPTAQTSASVSAPVPSPQVSVEPVSVPSPQVPVAPVSVPSPQVPVAPASAPVPAPSPATPASAAPSPAAPSPAAPVSAAQTPVAPALPNPTPKPVVIEKTACASEVMESIQEEKTVLDEPQAKNSLAASVKQSSASSIGKTVSYFDSIASMDGNQSDSSMPLVIDPVVGWLICVRGNHLGESFQIFAGANSIGRGLGNRIVLAREGAVSREKHAILTYEPRQMKFYIKPGESSGLTYLNGEYITESHPLTETDAIEFGDSKYILVPLCGERFSWDNYIKNK